MAKGKKLVLKRLVLVLMDLNRRLDGEVQIGHGQDGMNLER